MKRLSKFPAPRLTLLALGTLCLTACGARPPAEAFNAAPVANPTKPTTNPCTLLPVKIYPHAFSFQIAAELAGAPSGAAWPVAMGDYVALRDAVRACRGDKPHG